MRGCDDDGKPHVFVENKFWAGLTENQPVSYLQKLAKCPQPTILVVVGPENRKERLWGDLNQRLADDKILATEGPVAGIFRVATTSIGPILALTSWTKLLSALEIEVADDQSARSDLLQLRALCEAADSDAFEPISSEEASDQRTPRLILQLSFVVQASVNLAVTEGVLHLDRLKPQADASRIGRYAYIGDGKGAGLWLGIHFGLWKEHGGTPLWVVFSPGWGRADEVRALLEPWAAKHGVFATNHEDDSFVVAIDIAFREDKDQVVRRIVDRLKEIADVLSTLKSKSVENPNNE
jgi:hypothetical protein